MSARKTVTCLLLVALTTLLLMPVSAQASFGIKSFSVTARNEDGSVDFQAGSHPYEWELSLEMNQDAKGKPEGKISRVVVSLPPGMVGNPRALPRCTGADFEGLQALCPGDTNIGIIRLHLTGTDDEAVGPVFNLTPPFGAPAMVGFSVISENSFQEASLRSDTDYGVDVSDITVPTGQEIQSLSETIWGVPADPTHDAERQCFSAKGDVFGCPSDAQPPVPFFTLPTSCGEPLETTVRVEALGEPGVFDEATALSEEGGEAFGMSGCNEVQYEPEITAQPTTSRADSPSGLDFTLHQPQNEEPEALSTAHLKDTTVTLPEGLSVNPSSADGLEACSEQQIGYQPWEGKVRFTEEAQSCPDASKLGSLEVIAPPIGEFDQAGKPQGTRPLKGAVYLATPYQNPFDSLIAIYLAVEDEQTGIVAKLAGKVTPDPQAGQLTATFKDNPQLPLEDVKLHFFTGARASLRTPIACGEHLTTSTLVPWSSPEGEDAHPEDSFETTLPAEGSGPCPETEAQAPNEPDLEAGTVNPQAGAFSPFVLKLTRKDGSQELGRIDATMPPGLTGRLAGLAICSDSQLAQAASRNQPEEGILEKESPSCPSSSEIGTATVGAGAGPNPFHVTGHAYLAGPYKGAPVSIAFITAAIAGPFDLGAVVVRAPLYIDPETGQVSVKSDPIPRLLQGLKLDVRSVTVHVDRPNFTLNPTSCDPMAVSAQAISVLEAVASLSERFQVGGCEALPFKPKLSIALRGKTRRGGFPALRAVLKASPGEANIATVSATLPHSEFIEQGHFVSICTRVQFAEGKGGGEQCPQGSIYGHVKATSPLVDYALEGPVLLRSHPGRKLPDVVGVVKGPDYQPVVVASAGLVDSVKGALRTRFTSFPDLPISEVSLEMAGGRKSLFINSEDLCAKVHRAQIFFTAHNGKYLEARPAVKTSCHKHRKKKRHGKRGGHR